MSLLDKCHAIIAEETNPRITGQFTKVNERGVESPMTLPEINTVVMTYYNQADSAIINSRNGQNIKNANNFIIYDDGRFKWTLQNADTTIQDTTLAHGKLEEHVVNIRWTDQNNIVYQEEFSIYIRQSLKVT